MTWQSVITAALVAACSLYAAWALMPAALRRALARQLLRWPLPQAWARRLRQHAQAATSCSCSGCDQADKKPSTGAKTITIHRR